MHRSGTETEITYATRWLDAPHPLDRGRVWGLAFTRAGDRLAYVTHDLGFCQVVLTDLAGRERRPLVSLEPDEVISEVHGFGKNDRTFVFSVQVRGRHEIRIADTASRTSVAVAREVFFGGWDDLHDAFLVWDRATGTRRVMRVRDDGRAVLVDAGHMDRRVARSEDGRTTWFAQKFVDDPLDRRFILYRAQTPETPSGRSDGSERVAIAMIATTCRTARLKIELSPGGRYVHASAFGPIDDSGETVSFDLVVAADGSHRRLVPVKGWVSGERAVVQGRNGALQIVDIRHGVRRPFVLDPVEQFAVARGGEKVAYSSASGLHLADVPAP